MRHSGKRLQAGPFTGLGQLFDFCILGKANQAGHGKMTHRTMLPEGLFEARLPVCFGRTSTHRGFAGTDKTGSVTCSARA